MSQARGLGDQAMVEQTRGPAGVAEAIALQRRAWVVLVSLSLPTLRKRLR